MTEPNPTAADKTAEPDNLTVEQLLSGSTLGGQPEPTEEEPEAEAEEAEEEVEAAEAETEPEETEEEAEESEPVGIDLESLSEEELQALAEKLRSKAISRYGQLTKRAKDAEEKLAALQANATEKPAAKPVENNPFRELTSIEDIDAKKAELEGVIEATDVLLDDNDDIGNDDVINYKGAEFTKRQLKAAQRNARKALDKFLPAQEAAIKEQEQVAKMAEYVEGQVEEKFGESLADDAFSQRYQAVLDDPEIKRVAEVSPKLAAQLPWIAAHYVRSLILDEAKPTKTKPAQPTKGAAPKIKPPSSPGSVGAPTSKPPTADDKKAARRRELEATGNITPDQLAEIL